MKTIAAVTVILLAACASYAQVEAPPIDPNAPVQLVPAVVYQAPVVYTAPVVYNSPVVYEAPVIYQPPTVAAPPPPMPYIPPVMQEIAPNVYQYSDKVLIIASPMYPEPPEFSPGGGAQVIYFGGGQGGRQGYHFSHPR